MSKNKWLVEVFKIIGKTNSVIIGFYIYLHLYEWALLQIVVSVLVLAVLYTKRNEVQP